MVFSRLPLKDPRTVARDIPGIFDVIFPQLTPGVVAYFNKRAIPSNGVTALPDELVEASSLKHAMLFEIAFARGEQILKGVGKADWDECLKLATKRQKRHFDAKLPDALTDNDIIAADWVGNNLATMLKEIASETPDSDLISAPPISGYQWIASGEGDFSIGADLIEVKCINKNFGSADYRQVLMYWLLSYVSTLEHDTHEWENAILLNPRLNQVVKVPFNEIINITAAGRSKVEILELFSSIIGDYALKALPEFKL